MLTLSFVRPWSLATIVGLSLWLAAAAPAHSANVLENLKAGPGVSAPDTLPAARSPRFYRQTVVATCNLNSPKFGSNTCLMIFDRVPAAHLLQIDTIQCNAPGGGGAILFSNQLKLDATHLVAMLTPAAIASSLSEAHGPFYMKERETPKALAAGSLPTDTAICSINGTMWTTN